MSKLETFHLGFWITIFVGIPTCLMWAGLSYLADYLGLMNGSANLLEAIFNMLIGLKWGIRFFLIFLFLGLCGASLIGLSLFAKFIAIKLERPVQWIDDQIGEMKSDLFNRGKHKDYFPDE